SWLARFRCVLCYYDGHQEPQFFEGICEGRIEVRPLGQGGFGYDPLFYSLELQKGLGVASEEEKALVSHRSRAVSAFLSWVRSHPHMLT
ncbi:MAG: non-canonical purine NTP pyrophosphatase, partial [Proteobacteria bacterium]|nr:non-canonical purine NTP pyrophosphatase [Pseudomonadota bacterium]